jgi:predicted phosphodiesterase
VKLALLSDLHGNLEALDAVLRDVDRTSPAAKLVCAGDVVGYGPDPEACIARLRERQALCVMGNHEEMVLGRRDFSRCVHAGIIAAVWTREHLTDSAWAFMEALPHRLEAAPGVVVCHGDLLSADTYVSTREQAEEALAQLRAAWPQAAVLVCGHTHRAALFTSADGFRQVSGPGDQDFGRAHPCLINPGAVGQSRDTNPLARYAVLDVERQTVSFRELPYDHLTTLRKLRQAKLVARVVLPPPRGLWRRVEAYKAGWARRWSARRPAPPRPLSRNIKL